MKLEVFNNGLWYAFDQFKQYGMYRDGFVMQNKINTMVHFRDCL